MNSYGMLNYIRYVLMEKPRGLDFSKPDDTLISSNSLENYYSRTDNSTLKQVKEFLCLSEEDSFLDIGCGKGFVLYYFAKETSAKICGIEIFEKLADIAINNMRIMKMEQRVEIEVINALDFDRYREFNCFFLFNPFKIEVTRKVLGKIVDSIKNNPRRIRVVSVQPFFNTLLLEKNFELEFRLKSKLTGVETSIFTYNKNL